MEIPLNAEVHCTDGPCGHSVCLIVNPVNKTVTHFVVQTGGLDPLEYLVPLDTITSSSAGQIQLRCTKEELAQVKSFQRESFVEVTDPTFMDSPFAYGSEPDGTYMWPYVKGESGSWGMYTTEEQMPQGELGLHRGSEVEATDGRVGHVDAFMVDPDSNQFTHLVLREGHLWGQKDVTIPVSQVDHLENDVVYLKLSKAEVETLPSVPVQRWWRHT